jgi:hypothetical protein
VFQILNNEFNQLHQHTHAYLQSIGQIHVIYQIPRARTSHRRTQPYGENDTLSSNIDDIIIDTISKTRQPIANIAHSKNQEDLEFQNFLDFPKVDSTFCDLPEIEAGGFGPPEPLEINPPCTNAPSPRQNFNSLATMEANKPWLAPKSIVVPDAQHPFPKHLEKLLRKFDPDKDVTPQDHIKQFMLSLRQIDVQHEYVVCRLFP